MNFEQIARTLLASGLDAADPQHPALTSAAIAEQLRLVWNARGAADIAKVEAELSQMMGATASGPYLKNLDSALRTLDR